MRYLPDTNIFSEVIRPKPNEEVLSRMQMLARECALATPVWHELLYGFHRMPKGRKERTLGRYLFEVVDLFPKLPYDAKAASWHAQERARLERLGRPEGFVDGQIAAVAATNNLNLVTRNVQDFERFEGLRVENWFA